jgi:hypothetical protein
MVVSGQLHASVALSSRKSPRYPLDRRLGGPWSRSGLSGKEKILPLPRIKSVARRHDGHQEKTHDFSLVSAVSCLGSVRCLLYESVCTWDSVALNFRVTSWVMNCNGFGRKWSWSTRVTNTAFVWRDKKNRSSGRDSNCAPLEYKSRTGIVTGTQLDYVLLTWVRAKRWYFLKRYNVSHLLQIYKIISCKFMEFIF